MFTITSWFCLTRTLTDFLKVLWLLWANVNISEISFFTLYLSLQILTSRNQTLEIRGCCFLWRQHDGTKASVAMRTTKSAKCLMATWSKWSSTQAGKSVRSSLIEVIRSVKIFEALRIVQDFVLLHFRFPSFVLPPSLSKQQEIYVEFEEASSENRFSIQKKVTFHDGSKNFQQSWASFSVFGKLSGSMISTFLNI